MKKKIFAGYAFNDDNNTIVKAKVDEIQKISTKNQKPPGYAFNDDIDEPSAEKNSRYNN